VSLVIGFTLRNEKSVTVKAEEEVAGGSFGGLDLSDELQKIYRHLHYPSMKIWLSSAQPVPLSAGMYVSEVRPV